MFSPMINNLISSGGQDAAIQRSIQLQNYVSTMNKPAVTPQAPTGEGVPSFANVLQQSAGATKFGSLVTRKPSADVMAKIFNAQQTANVPDLSGLPNVNTSANAPKSQILKMIDSIANKHGVDEKLVRALVKQESGFNPKATSHCGAMGLMQLMPATAKGLGVTDAYNPVQNVDGGVRYLKGMLQKYNGNVVLALAAYNAGPGAVDKYDGVPPFKETQNYVKSILANYL